MKSAVAVWIILAVACIDARLVSDNEKTRNDLLQDNGSVTCVCNGLTKRRRLPRSHLSELVLGMMNADLDVKKYPAISHMLQQCSNCSATIISCDSPSQESPYCIQRDITMEDSYISDKDLSASRRRTRRYVEHCGFPKNMKTSYLTCTEYPSSVTCKQMCIFGFTLDEGITRDMKCTIKENVWKPAGFLECSPFVDCTMNLIAPGWKSCRFGTIYTPSECNVTCGHYEDKDEVPMQTYICDVSKGWTQKLPHCVTPGSGFATVPAPRIKLHTLPSESTPQPKKKWLPPQTPEPKKVEFMPTQKTVKIEKAAI